jgi:hypothetical protein
MSPCLRTPNRGRARDEWSNRWHAVVCEECRGARAADRKLARAARELRRLPAPPGMEADLLAGLGLMDVETAGRRLHRDPWRLLAIRGFRPSRTAALGRLVIAALAGILLIGLGTARSRWKPVPGWRPERASAGPRRGVEPVAPAQPSPLDEQNGRVAASPVFPPPQPRTPERTLLGSTEQHRDDVAVDPPAPRRFPAPGRTGDDLKYVNGEGGGPRATVGQRDRVGEIARRDVSIGDDFVWIPLPRVASTADRQAVDAVETYRREAAIVDPRLARAVTLEQKATALADLCDRLRSDTGVHLAAGSSVADEKVTLFCDKQPLRDVMRQLSRPFGYTWLRSGKVGEYKYELVQDLRSQLLEEELRNRDRNAALLALEKEIERYRPYLDLTPDEALARSKTGARGGPSRELPAEKRVVEQLASLGWGPVHVYFRLAPGDLAALRAGQELHYSAAPDAGQRLLPPEIARGVLQSMRDLRIVRYEADRNGSRQPFFRFAADPNEAPDGLPPAAVPEARAMVALRLDQSEPGQFTLRGQSGLFASARPGQPPDFAHSGDNGPLAEGRSPTSSTPDSAAADPALARDPSLRARVTVRPQPSCGSDLSPGPSLGSLPSWRHAGGPAPRTRGGAPGDRPPKRAFGAPRLDRPADTPALPGKGERLPLPASGRGSGGEVNSARVTSADVLAELHRATGLPIVGDYYTRLYTPEAVSVRTVSLYDALNQIAGAMRVRWSREGGWLQFRSRSFYYDRLKEVPNRLLARWAGARRRQGALTLDDLVEIAQLSDAQLDAAEMAEGARMCFGLAEWELPRNWALRRHLRYLAGFTPAQRQEAMSPAGLPFPRMSLAQQQGFIAHALGPSDEPLQSVDELAGATLRVDYTLPGGFAWRAPTAGAEWLQWVVPAGPGRRAPRPLVRERTRAAALEAARRIDPQIRPEILRAARRLQPALAGTDLMPQETQIVPTTLNLTVLYIPGASHERPVRWWSLDNQTAMGTW